jgi:hypothetical protein
LIIALASFLVYLNCLYAVSFNGKINVFIDELRMDTEENCYEYVDF